jgi:citrate lyase beta subunit
VAMVAVLFPISDEEPKLEASALEELARLGITSVALLRDSSIAGLVLEGWAFDARDVERAARAVAGTSDGVQTLRPLVQMSVSAAHVQGARNNVKGEAR